VAGDPKKGAAENAHLVLIDEAGPFLNPLVRRAWAPAGRPPVPEAGGRHRDKVSAIGAVTVSPVAGRLGFYFATDPADFFNAGRVAGALRGLLRHLRGRVIAVRDGGSNHNGPVVREFLRRSRRPWLGRRPAYAPELNPVEAAWPWLKYGALANFVPAGVEDLDGWVLDALVGRKHEPGLLRRLWDGSELPFPGATATNPGLPAGQ